MKLIKTILKNLLPYGIVAHKSQLVKITEYILYKMGFSPRKCPICGKRLYRFDSWYMPVSGEEVKEMECPSCHSHPRHRKLWVYLQKKTRFFEMRDSHFLHIAPEPCYRERFEKIFPNYVTADLYDPSVMVKMDITKIEYPDDSFDIIFCSHVLQNIPEDIKAMSELRRVLKKDGMAILLDRVSSNIKTLENHTITAPEDRLRTFGYPDKVRLYGQDYPERLRLAGFTVSVINESDYMSKREQRKFSRIDINDIIFHCTKRPL
jgi:hypothetical protein